MTELKNGGPRGVSTSLGLTVEFQPLFLWGNAFPITWQSRDMKVQGRTESLTAAISATQCYALGR